MTEIFRRGDVVVHGKGDSCTVRVSPEMAANGWRGGQGVRWANVAGERFAVERSDGTWGGFMLWGSNEGHHANTSLQGAATTYGYGVFAFGNWIMSTLAFERYTWASRNLGGPLVELTYVENRKLWLSLGGLWTSEDEWTLAGDPRAPNMSYAGSIIAPPSASNGGYLVLMSTM